MGDPLPDVDVGVDVVPPVTGDEPNKWLVRNTPHSWDVWIFARERRPRRLRDIRGKVAAVTAGVIIGVLGLGGLISYTVSWQSHVDQASALLSSDMRQVEESLLRVTNPLPTDPQTLADLAVKSVDTPDGAVGLVNSTVASWTPAASRAAADENLVADFGKRDFDGSYVTYRYSSASSVYVYMIMPITMDDGTVVEVVRVIDLTSDRGRLAGDYLRYGLGGLAGAGAAAGAVWWGLGRRRNSIEEPYEA
jgi:hypothetical protein